MLLTSQRTTHSNKNSFRSASIPLFGSRRSENVSMRVTLDDSKDLVSGPTLKQTIYLLDLIFLHYFSGSKIYLVEGFHQAS